MHITRALFATSLILGSLIGCAGTPDDGSGDMAYADVEPATEADKPRFEGDAEFYGVNAQRFYDAGDFLAALQQFRRQLDKQPTAIDGRLGEAFALYQLGIQHGAVGNLREAQRRLDLAREHFEALSAELPVESDTSAGDG
ncbi:MAG: hypothetical protein KDB53_09670, partial [Planctomycetes bacterium]|nr:hypothetical protein [Planctomycetota bacterium]